MLTDASLLEWMSGWLRPNTDEDPTFRRRCLDGLLAELEARRVEERARVCAWLQSEDARRYTEVGPLVADAIAKGRHLEPATPDQAT